MLHKRYATKLMLFSLILFGFSSCIINDNIKDSSGFIDPGNDPNFNIVVNKEAGYELFNRKVVVFDIPIYAFATVEDTKLLHAANILAQYLDNDEDGVVDNLVMHADLIANNGFVFLWKTTEEKDSFTPPNGHNGKDISADAINLIWHSNGHTGDFDAAIETFWKFIAKVGYETTYPAIFSGQTNSELSLAMDIARGGHFQSPPVSYPSGAWFTNTDVTCTYACQITSYNYWVLSSKLGAQENRLNDIQNEWTLNTKTKVETSDVKAWAIFNDATYKLPSILPDGTYKQ